MLAYPRLYSSGLRCDDGRMLRFRWLCLAAGLAVAAVVAAVLCSRPPLVSEANLSRIQVGMSKAEVEAILGKPQMELFSQFTSGPARTLYSGDILLSRDSVSGAVLYEEDRLLRPRQDILVVSFHNGVVDKCWITFGPPDERDLWQRLRDRFGEVRASLGW
jgi:hypothetical protein